MCYTKVVGTIVLIKICCRNSLVVTKFYIVIEQEQFELVSNTDLSQNMSLAHICYKTI